MRPPRGTGRRVRRLWGAPTPQRSRPELGLDPRGARRGRRPRWVGPGPPAPVPALSPRLGRVEETVSPVLLLPRLVGPPLKAPASSVAPPSSPRGVRSPAAPPASLDRPASVLALTPPTPGSPVVVPTLLTFPNLIFLQLMSPDPQVRYVYSLFLLL